LRRILLFLLKAGVSVGLIAVFFVRIDWPDVLATVEGANLRLLLGAAGLFLASNLLGALQWDLLLRAQGISMPHLRVQKLYMIGVFFNNFLVSNIGGDAVRVYDLRRMTGEGSPGFAATFVDRFIGLFTMILFSLAAYAASPTVWSPALLAPILALSGILAGVLAVGFSRRLSGILEHIGRRLLPLPLGERIGKIRGSFILYRSRMRTLALVLAISLVVQLLRIGVYYSVSQAMNLDVAFRHFMVFIPMIAIVAAVPISFGGIGVRENFGALLFHQVGVGLAPSLAMLFLGYLAGIAVSLAGGVAFVLRKMEAE
jgi:uncharacterized protein (TIRG00374 family)